MPLILPDNYLLSDYLQIKYSENKIFYKSEAIYDTTIRLAIINIMPEAEKYEESLLKLFIDFTEIIEIVFVRLINHKYKSSDAQHLNAFYTNFDNAVSCKKPDGLVITGAPVELVQFQSISYYNELLEILKYANNHIKSTLGICWGGIFIGNYLGIKNQILSEKLFGVFPAEYTSENNWLKYKTAVFNCPQSRYAGLDQTDLENSEKEGAINILCKSDEGGGFIFESSNHKFVAHLGHPEYEPERLIFEYKRDTAKGLNHFPLYLNIKNPDKNWQNHANDFFGSWINLINPDYLEI